MIQAAAIEDLPNHPAFVPGEFVAVAAAACQDAHTESEVGDASYLSGDAATAEQAQCPAA